MPCYFGLFFGLNILLQITVSTGKSAKDDSPTTPYRNYSVLAVGTVGQYYIDGIFNFLNASKSKDLSLTTDQLSFLLKKLDIAPDTKKYNDSGNITNSSRCFTAEGLLDLYNLEIDGVPVDSFLSICPALIYGQISEECTHHTAEIIESSYEDDDEYSSTDSEKYGYGILAVAVISIITMVLFVVVPRKKRKIYPYVIDVLMSLAVGTLVSDTFLHLVPGAIGAKDLVTHYEGDTLPTVSSRLWMLVAVIGAIYGMYLFSMLMEMRERVISKRYKRQHHHHHHHHHPHHRPHQDSTNQGIQDNPSSRNSHRLNDTVDGDENHENGQVHAHHRHHHEPHYWPGDGLFDWAQKVTSGDVDSSSSSSSSSDSESCDESPQKAETSSGKNAETASERNAETSRGQNTKPSVTNTSKAPPMKRNVSFSAEMSRIAEDEEPTDQQPDEDKSISVEATVPKAPCRTSRLNSIISLHENLPHHFHRAQSVASLKSQEAVAKVQRFKKECTPKKHYGWVIIVGDLIHNVMDGAAIGTAFSKNPISGLATTIAVGCHEIPHEIGDFAALMTSGVTWKGAMAWNVIITLSAFCGLFIGITIGKNEEAVKWVYAIMAGVFLHHALGEFLPDLMHIESNFWVFLALQHIGLFFGFGVMLVILIFEHSLYDIGK